MKEIGIKILTLDNYLSVIKKSVGVEMFQNLYAQVNGRKKDLARRGGLACAFYVSSILTMFNLIKAQHATVEGTIKDLKKSDWRLIKKPKAGSVLVWEKNKQNRSIHRHIGFYLGEQKAVSNNYQTGRPTIHHWQFNGRRKVELIFWRPNW